MEDNIIIDSELLHLEGTGMTAQAVSVGGKEYSLHLPSLVNIQRVGEYLSEMVSPQMASKTIEEAVRTMTDSLCLVVFRLLYRAMRL